MAEISLLEPRVLNGVVTHFLEDPEPQMRGMTLLGGGVPDLNPTFEYDIVRGSRDVSTPNAPNAEARRVDHMQHGKLTGSYIYLRDKKMFNATTLRWLRVAGENEVNAANAEKMVMGELNDMDFRQKRYIESTIWDMFSGSVTYTHEGGATATLDYGISVAHRPTAGTPWGDASDDPIGDIGAWKQLTTHDASQELTSVYMNAATMVSFQKLPEVRAQLSDRQKDVMTSEGFIPRFQGLDWIEYDQGHVVSGTFTPYITTNRLVMLAPGNNAWQMKHGPSADDSAPTGQTGSFSKTWKEEDPSNRQVLIERIFVPCLFRPDQVVFATID